MLQSLLNKTFLLQHRCFPENIAKFSRTRFFFRTPPVAAFVFLQTVTPNIQNFLKLSTETSGILFQVNRISLCKPLFHYNHANLSRGWSCRWVSNPYHTIGLFLYPLKTKSFRMFSGGVERDQWHDVRECWICTNHLSTESILNFFLK